MKKPLFIGTDIGTQGTKSVITDENGKILGSGFTASNIIRGENGSVTENPEDIFNSVIVSVRKAVEASGIPYPEITGFGIDGQMAGIMGIGSDFEPVGPLDSWLDSRSEPYAEFLRGKAEKECVVKSGGQVINSHAAKILRIMKTEPELYGKISKFVMPNGFAAGKLCGLSAESAFMDYTFLHFNNFSDNLKKRFNREALDFFKVDRTKMPRVCAPGDIIGKVLPKYAELMGISGDISVIAGCGDTAASSLGAGIVSPGLAYDVAGTASVFACCTDRYAPDTENRTVLFSRSVIDGLYLPLSYITGGGLTLKWFSELVKTELSELDGKAAECSSKLFFIPHLSGRAFPPDARLKGAFVGLDGAADEGKMFRAVMESIGFEYRGYLEVMQSCGCIERLKAVRCVGGGAKSPVFCKIKADILGADYISSEHICSAPQAVARLAAYSLGYSGTDIRREFKITGEGSLIKHSPAAKQAYDKRYISYKRLLNNYSDFLAEEC